MLNSDIQSQCATQPCLIEAHLPVTKILKKSFMKYEAARLKDISKALGLSVSTISRALNDSYEISEKTKKIVREYAEKIN